MSQKQLSAIHREIVDHSLALLDAWRRSDVNVVLVDRWYESYDHLPRDYQSEIETAIAASGFRLRRFLLLVTDNIRGDEEGAMRERMLHTKANRSEAWWATGPSTINDWVREECAYQDEYRQFSEQSRFPAMNICTSTMAWDEYETEIANALLRTSLIGGLGANKRGMTPPTSCSFNFCFP